MQLEITSSSNNNKKEKGWCFCHWAQLLIIRNGRWKFRPIHNKLRTPLSRWSTHMQKMETNQGISQQTLYIKRAWPANNVSFENVHCIGFTSPLNTTMSGRTSGKCRLHGKIELLKGHKRVCPYSNCSCARCTTHDQVLAMKYTQRETKEDKGRQWQMSLASSANLTRSKETATAGVSSATSFPEMASSALNNDSVLALQIANFETAKQAVEKTMPKADQRKGELLICFLAWRKIRNYHKLCPWELPIFFRFPLILHNMPFAKEFSSLRQDRKTKAGIILVQIQL